MTERVVGTERSARTDWRNSRLFDIIKNSGNPTFPLPCDDPMAAYRSIYRRFLLNPALTEPECVIYGGADTMKVYENGELPSEREFIRRMSDPNTDTVVCTASTDAADTRRVVLMFKCGAPAERECFVTFPCAKQGLVKEECALLELLRQPLEK